MSRIKSILEDLQGRGTPQQVRHYWEKRRSRIIAEFSKGDPDTVSSVIRLLAGSMNEGEAYGMVYDLFISGYRPNEKRLKEGAADLNETKFELARGLHHDRKYEHSRKLFNELIGAGRASKIPNEWLEQSAFGSARERLWIRTDLLPFLGQLILLITFMASVIKTGTFLIPAILLISIHEPFQAWRLKYKVDRYLKAFETEPSSVAVEQRLYRWIGVELLVSSIFIPAYFLLSIRVTELASIMSLFFASFHIGLNLFYLPKVIGELNKEKARKAGPSDP